MVPHIDRYCSQRHPSVLPVFTRTMAISKDTAPEPLGKGVGQCPGLVVSASSFRCPRSSVTQSHDPSVHIKEAVLAQGPKDQKASWDPALIPGKLIHLNLL